MHNWPNLDNLQFEKLGMSRNALFGTIFAAIVIYFAVDFFSQPYLEDANGLIQLAPMAGSVAFWWFVMIPQVRKWNETLPKGYFQGLADYYLFNPGNLEITNDPEPMPLYVPDRPERRPTDPARTMRS